MVGKSIIAAKEAAARNLPKIIFIDETGNVSRSS